MLALVLSMSGEQLFAQRFIQGIVKDAHSEEVIPFASVELIRSQRGTLTEADGTFSIWFQNWPLDTLLITYVGYQDYKLAIDSSLVQRAVNDTLTLLIKMERGKFMQEAVVRTKVDRGLNMWKRIVRQKPRNDRYRFDNFSYELYNKLEIDIKNIKRSKWEKMPIVKNFSFVFDNIDTTQEGDVFLPVYLTEAISDYYYQKNPNMRRREVFKGTKTIGVDNESINKFLGGMEQNVNVYSNFIPVFDKNFVSPFSDNGNQFYKYHVLDSQFVNGRRLIHMTFTPKRPGENTFEGDAWVHDTTWAVQKVNLRLAKNANINYVDKLSLIQEFSLVNDTTWFLSRDKFVVDFSFAGEKVLAAIGKKSTTYKHIKINDPAITALLATNQTAEDIVYPDSTNKKSDEFWTIARHEPLSLSEQKLYHTIDTLLQMPSFQRTTKMLYFLGTGWYNIGKFEIGPWYNWMTYNQYEGFRTRFDLGTNKELSKNIYLHGYLAYGFKDKELKYKLDGLFIVNRNPRTQIFVSHKYDLDRGQSYYDAISQDNIFALAIRKTGVPIKFLMTRETEANFHKEWLSGFGFDINTKHREFMPKMNLPYQVHYQTAGKDSSISSSEVSIKLRYAYLEKFLEGDYLRYSLGSKFPIVELKYTKGLKGVLGSQYGFDKLSFSVSDWTKISPFGEIYFNAFGGKTWGKLPYMLLDIAPGNEIHYYNRYAFNLMNRFEYIHDEYAGINFEHNFGNSIFRFVPGIKKLKLRQFWTAKALVGNLSDENYNYNFSSTNPYPFKTLDNKVYVELGTGIDNIFKLFRFDLVWRVSPTPMPVKKVERFGAFFSFRLVF